MNSHPEQKEGSGLRAVSLPDLCHHAEYRIYIDGQYVCSEGNKGNNATRALEFWQRKNRHKTVEIKPMSCRVPGCQWRAS